MSEQNTIVLPERATPIEFECQDLGREIRMRWRQASLHERRSGKALPRLDVW